MMKKQTGRAPSMARSVLTGTAISTGWTMLCAILVAKLIDSEAMLMDTVGYASMAAHVSAAYMGTKAAYNRAGHMGDSAAGLTGLSYYIVLLLVNALFFGGHFTGLGVTLVLITLGSGAVILTTGKGRSRSGHRKYKIPGT